MIKDENMEKLWRTEKLVVPNFNDYINKINKKSNVVPVTNNYFIVAKFLSSQLSREVWEQKKKHKKATAADFYNTVYSKTNSCNLQSFSLIWDLVNRSIVNTHFAEGILIPKYVYTHERYVQQVDLKYLGYQLPNQN